MQSWRPARTELWGGRVRDVSHGTTVSVSRINCLSENRTAHARNRPRVNNKNGGTTYLSLNSEKYRGSGTRFAPCKWSAFTSGKWASSRAWTLVPRLVPAGRRRHVMASAAGAGERKEKPRYEKASSCQLRGPRLECRGAVVKLRSRRISLDDDSSWTLTGGAALGTGASATAAAGGADGNGSGNATAGAQGAGGSGGATGGGQGAGGSGGTPPAPPTTSTRPPTPQTSTATPISWYRRGVEQQQQGRPTSAGQHQDDDDHARPRPTSASGGRRRCRSQ